MHKDVVPNGNTYHEIEQKHLNQVLEELGIWPGKNLNQDKGKKSMTKASK